MTLSFVSFIFGILIFMLPRRIVPNKQPSVEMIDLKNNKPVSTHDKNEESTPGVIVTNRSILNLTSSNINLKQTSLASLESNIQKAAGLFKNKVYVLLVIAGIYFIYLAFKIVRIRNIKGFLFILNRILNKYQIKLYNNWKDNSCFYIIPYYSLILAKIIYLVNI